MTYPFVASATDLGPAKGPRLAVCWHMAEGNGTVGFLSRPNPNGVSVHFVVESTGRIVQMLPLDHMHSSIRTSDIRMTDDPDGFYGRSAARGVMGEWADVRTTLGPNHASIGVEVEGFAAAGPNAAQRTAIAGLWLFLHDRWPGIRSLGHRDFADYKPCPGQHFPWGAVGGHGAEVEMLTVTSEAPVEVTVAAGVPWYDLDGATKLKTATSALAWRVSPFACGDFRAIYATVGARRLVLVKPSAIRPIPLPADASPFTQADVDKAWNAGRDTVVNAAAAVPRRTA